MKFMLTKASNFVGEPEEVEVNTLEDLQALSKKYGHELIVSFTNSKPDASNRIVVYDYYVE